MQTEPMSIAVVESVASQVEGPYDLLTCQTDSRRLSLPDASFGRADDFHRDFAGAVGAAVWR